MPNVENILPHRWQRGGPSPNPGGRPSSKAALAHAMTETSDGKEIAERLIALMRHGKQESIRLKAACELRDWLFGSPSPDHALVARRDAQRSAGRDRALQRSVRAVRVEGRGHGRRRRRDERRDDHQRRRHRDGRRGSDRRRARRRVARLTRKPRLNQAGSRTS
jgi:hypothetical protein